VGDVRGRALDGESEQVSRLGGGPEPDVGGVDPGDLVVLAEVDGLFSDGDAAVMVSARGGAVTAGREAGLGVGKSKKSADIRLSVVMSSS
jgi:hypothetical protein